MYIFIDLTNVRQGRINLTILFQNQNPQSILLREEALLASEYPVPEVPSVGYSGTSLKMCTKDFWYTFLDFNFN